MAKPVAFIRSWSNRNSPRFHHRVADGNINRKEKAWKSPSALLDILVNIPLIVPSIALGVSLKFFWKESFPFMPEMLLLIFAHLAITYPYIVKSMAAAFERNMDVEEAARTLGPNL